MGAYSTWSLVSKPVFQSTRCRAYFMYFISTRLRSLAFHIVLLYSRKWSSTFNSNFLSFDQYRGKGSIECFCMFLSIYNLCSDRLDVREIYNLNKSKFNDQDNFIDESISINLNSTWLWHQSNPILLFTFLN